MNGHCSTCDVEKQCAYPYKPCDCCNYRKFKPMPQPLAKREPLTKTRIGNYLRKCDNGDVSMYRNGFKDGVRFAEAAHGIVNIGAKE